MADESCTLVIKLTDGLGEQRHVYPSKKAAMTRYDTVRDMLKGGAYKARGTKIEYAYLILNNGDQKWLKK